MAFAVNLKDAVQRKYVCVCMRVCTVYVCFVGVCAHTSVSAYGGQNHPALIWRQEIQTQLSGLCGRLSADWTISPLFLETFFPSTEVNVGTKQVSSCCNCLSFTSFSIAIWRSTKIHPLCRSYQDNGIQKQSTICVWSEAICYLDVFKTELLKLNYEFQFCSVLVNAQLYHIQHTLVCISKSNSLSENLIKLWLSCCLIVLKIKISNLPNKETNTIELSKGMNLVWYKYSDKKKRENVDFLIREGWWI